ncbi:hypothetical protein JAO73_10400 [Hymenobacter sp. BT523]|uniref:hypothetical protein n=1 Tax=Hymenobacter sp. BT523 TaxID=2795725 RepID=UPI0018EB6A65|nr:hypothetical protein [Hymenobacter sp. BT523]MBJ6109425.1 hypothetical protein [Hymenobacter sp. BT523]
MSQPRQAAGPEIAETFAQNERDLAEAWLTFSIEKFRANLKKLRIGSTQELYNSLAGELVSAAGGDELRLRLSYAVYGMFVDMGVGRGMGAGVTKAQGEDFARLRNARGQLHRHERKAKRWYSRQMGRETHRLSELVSELWGSVMLASVGSALPAEGVGMEF